MAKQTERQVSNKQRKINENSLANLKPWVKGQPSPNPEGRPPNDLSFSNIQRKVLSDVVPERVLIQVAELIFGNERNRKDIDTKMMAEWIAQHRGTLTWIQAWAIRNVFRGMSTAGDTIQKTVIEFLEGKALQRIADPDGKPLDFSNGLSKLSYERLKMLEAWLVEAGENGDGE